MGLRILKAELRTQPLRTRMPFRYGIATMTRVPLAFVRVEAEVNGRKVAGVASDLLPPKWFTKVPDKPLEQEVAEMQAVIVQAMKLATGRSGADAFQLWRRLYEDQLDWAREQGYPPLLANFGTSLVERALIEAVCRVSERSFFEALTGGVLGMDPGGIHPALKGADLEASLPSAPLDRVHARHTVGLGDPLTDAEVAEPLEDGLPQSLSACIRAYGLRHFKVKVTGDTATDLPRLESILALLRREAPAEFRLSLDGNEQFDGWGTFREYWERLLEHPGLQGLEEHLLFVEQPLHRDVALDSDRAGDLRQWEDHPACIIDESDATLESLPRALELGYAGTSHKNCKGVFKGVANACWLQLEAHGPRTAGGILSGEDLCNIGPVALLQDLAVMGALGIGSVERNGHHYHAGLSQLPGPVQEEVLTHHGDLYRRMPAGWPTVRIESGMISLASVNTAPFGVRFELDTGLFRLVEGFEA